MTTKPQIMQKNIYNNYKIMKKVTVILFMLISSLTFGQNEKKLERIKALQVAFISTKLDLSSEEAQKFWPVFNEFNDKQLELRKQKKILMFKLKSENSGNLSDKEIQKALDDSESIDNNIQSNRNQFVKNLKGVISPQKILLLKRLEEDFKNTMLKQFKERKGKLNQD
jgi:hypothetical protein